MIGLGNNLFGGKMCINGAIVKNAEQSVSKAAVDAANPAKSASAAQTGESAAKSANGNFAAEMSARLNAANAKNPEAAARLANGLSDTAQEVGRLFGQDKANAFMSQILTATDKDVNDHDLSAALGGFFRELSSEASKTTDGRANLDSMKTFLNQGLDLTLLEGEELADRLESESPGLSYNLNQYFDHQATFSDDRQLATTKGFNSSFYRANMQVSAAGSDPFGAGNTFNVKVAGLMEPSEISVDDETVGKLTTFLRGSLGNENAAAYLESGAPTDFLGAVATSMAIVKEENGQEAAYSFMNFLNNNVAGLMKTSDGLEMEGWRLSRDYANPDAPLPQGPPKKLWIASGGDELERKKHQGLTTNWLDTRSGVISEKSVDLNDLYAAYARSKQASAASLNKPAGNLVDATV